MDKLRTESNEVSIEKARLAAENRKLSRRADAARADSARLAQLETERDELRDTINRMRTSMDSLSASSRKLDEQEQKVSSLTTENNKMQRQVRERL